MARPKRSDPEPSEPAQDDAVATATAPEEEEEVVDDADAGVPSASSDAEGEAGETGAGEDEEREGEDASGEAAAEEASEKARRRKAPSFAPPPAERLEGAVEALLLAAGESLSDERLRDLLGLPSAVHVRAAVEAVRARWGAAGLPVEIQDVAGGRRVVTRPEYAEYVSRLHKKAAADRLSKTLLETLSIVAYRQPVARAEIERVRGVQSGDALRALLDRRLVKVSGRSDQPGRPLLYATTTRVLEVFGLASLSDLPNAKDLVRL
jgi:segregation and condensation protein B